MYCAGVCAERQHFDRVAAGVAEFAEQPTHAACADLVAARMRDDRLAARGMDPVDRLAERRPRLRDVTGLARHEIALEDVLDVARVAGLDEKAREMRARNEPFAGHELSAPS